MKAFTKFVFLVIISLIGLFGVNFVVFAGEQVIMREDTDGGSYIVSYKDDAAISECVKEETLVEAKEGSDTLKKLSTPQAEWVKEKKEITYTWQVGDSAPVELTETFYPGQVIVHRSEDSTNLYSIDIYRSDGTIIFSGGMNFGVTTKNSILTLDFFHLQFHESGDYYFTLKVNGDGTTSEDSDVFTSDIWHFETTGKRLETPEKSALKVDLEKRCFTYSHPEGYVGYKINAYFKRTLDDEPEDAGGMTYLGVMSSRKVDFYLGDWFLEELGNGYYYITVQYLSPDPENIQLSEESEPSDYLYIGKNTTQINEEIENAMEKISDDPDDNTKQEAVESIKNIGTADLREAMVTDVSDEGTNNLIKQMEDKLDIPVNKNIEGIEGMNVSSEGDIQIIGAGLNAADLGSGVSFNMGKPSKDVVVPGIYHSTIQVDFSLDGASYNGEKLAVPVKIVIPIPNDIKPSMLRILHYHNSTDTTDEIIFPHVFLENGKWYSSFVVDSFSDFVFAESDGSDAPSESIKIAVNQKLDVTSYFSKSYKKFGVSTDSKKIASVTNKGIVKGKKAGTAKIFGFEKIDKKWVADEANAIEVIVQKPEIAQKTVTLTKVNESFSGNSNIAGSDISPSKWISSKPMVVSVNESTGLITALGSGTSKITALYGDGKNAAKYSFSVKVVIPKLNKENHKMMTGATVNLKVKNTTIKPQWESSDEELATVTEDGKVTALRAGELYITATIEDVGYSCKISITEPKLSKSEVKVKAGKTVLLKVTNTKLKANDFSWTSADEDCATVAENGKVTGVKAGTAKITVLGGGMTSICTVTVQ